MVQNIPNDSRVRGPTGVVGFAADARLTEEERQVLRGNVTHIVDNANDPEGFFDRLALAANWLKGWVRVDCESSVAGREDDLRRAIAAVRGGDWSSET